MNEWQGRQIIYKSNEENTPFGVFSFVGLKIIANLSNAPRFFTVVSVKYRPILSISDKNWSPTWQEALIKQ